MENEWIKEINYQKYLDGDLKILAEIIGIEKLCELYKHFSKTTIYFTERPIMEMKQEYIRKKYGYINEKKLARMLDVSERLIYKIGSEKYINKEQQELFDE